MTNTEIIDITNSIFDIYGYDIRNYDISFLERSLLKFFKLNHIHHDFKNYILKDETLIHQFIDSLFINVSTMFRDPFVFETIAKNIIPNIDSYPTIKIWSAGCANGEEIYSIAIILKELGLYDRSILYATDIDEDAIENAKLGKYSIKNGLEFCQNYYLAKRESKFNKYFDIKDDYIYINDDIKKNICFSTHNIITDDVFNTFNIILCRNMFIYFNYELQKRALNIFHKSLENSGFLVLGQSESIQNNSGYKYFKEYSKEKKIYKNIKDFNEEF
jgi:chemotaxis protein methyltransferase CheR